MTTLFDRLAARSLGQQPALRPRVPGLFESMARDEGGFVEVTDERLAAAPAAARTTERRVNLPPAVATDERNQPTRDARPPADAQPMRAEAPRKMPLRPEPAPVAPAVPERSAPRDPAEAATVRHDHIVTRETQVVRPARLDTSAQALHAQAPARPAEAPAALPVAPPFAPVPPSLAPIPVVTRRLADPAAVAAALHTAPPAHRPPERRVEVHIEHLEIRQQPAAPSRRPRREPPTFPGPDLDTYLGRKGT